MAASRIPVETGQVEIRISLTKHSHSTVLACTRSDGSVTWQKTSQGSFFGQHDLLNYAIESTLGLRQSFFGLIAAGRSIASFEDPGTAATLPVEAIHTELMVNQLMIELNYESPSIAASFNKTIADSCVSSRRSPIAPPPAVTDAQLNQIRERFAESNLKWQRLGEGEKMELEFSDR